MKLVLTVLHIHPWNRIKQLPCWRTCPPSSNTGKPRHSVAAAHHDFLPFLPYYEVSMREWTTLSSPTVCGDWFLNTKHKFTRQSWDLAAATIGKWQVHQVAVRNRGPPVPVKVRNDSCGVTVRSVKKSDAEFADFTFGLFHLDNVLV